MVLRSSVKRETAQNKKIKAPKLLLLLLAKSVK